MGHGELVPRKSSLSDNQIALVRKLKTSNELTDKQIAERVGTSDKPCTPRQVAWYGRESTGKIVTQQPLPDPLAALQIELVNSYLMDAVKRLATDEQRITGSLRADTRLRIDCIEAIIKVRNSIEASREVGDRSVIVGEMPPGLTRINLDFIPKEQHEEYMEAIEEWERKLMEDGGKIETQQQKK